MNPKGIWRIQEGSGAEGEPRKLQKVLREELRESPRAGMELGSGGIRAGILAGSMLIPGWDWGWNSPCDLAWILDDS